MWSARWVWPKFSLVWYFLHGKRQRYSDKRASSATLSRPFTLDIPNTHDCWTETSPPGSQDLVHEFVLVLWNSWCSFISTTFWTASSSRSHMLCREVFLLSVVLSSSYGIFSRCLQLLVLHVLVNSSTLGSSTTIHNILSGRYIHLKRIHRKCSRTCKWQELLWSLLKSYTTLIPQDIPAQEINIFKFFCVW